MANHKRIGDIIPAQFRNCGASLGLQYPWISAHDLTTWVIWCRHCGVIVYVSTENNEWEAERLCNLELHRLNGLDPHSVAPDILTDIDNTP